ncbi:MAG: hypothetical protein ACERKD_02970 [Prolixibacteraceae bacterium]
MNHSSDIFVNGSTPAVYSIFRDQLGTITHLKSASDTLEYSYDAYGHRRDKDTWSYTIDDTNALFADRGFTGHEHLSEFGLINMNLATRGAQIKTHFKLCRTKAKWA